MSRRTITRLGATTMMAAGALSVAVLASPGTANACSQYIQPYNPYVDTCGIPSGPPVVRGGSPSAGSIIACRGIPGCLSAVVNGGPGGIQPGYGWP
jgi:hypothetical protein